MTIVLDGSSGITAPGGTAAAPSITTTGDTNTGIYFPAADTIAFTEGGVEAARFNSSGVFTTTNDATIQGLTVGRGAGAVATNTVVGASALAANVSGVQDTAIGVSALAATTGGYNTAVGYQAGLANTSGAQNVFVGRQAGYLNTTGNLNVFVGESAGYYNTTGTSNTALGNAALVNSTASGNTAVGYQAAYSNTTGIANAAFGGNNPSVTAAALYSNTTGNYNTALGISALWSNTTASNNTAVGYQSLQANTTASSNTAVGYQALYPNTTGVSNVGVGVSAFPSNTTGSYNVGLGASVLNVNTTGSGNVMLGSRASDGTYTPVFDPTTQNDRFIAGTTYVTNAYVKVAWTVTSDARDKTDVQPVPHGLAFVQQLNPVSYKFKKSREDDTPSGNKRYGFLAQEVLALEGDDPVIIDNETPDHLKYQGESLVPILVKAIQELSAKVTALESK